MSERVGAGPRAIPPLVWAAWGTALAVLAVLALAVTSHLSGGQSHSGMSGMAGMSPGSADDLSHALYRTTGADPHGPLLSSKLITAWQLDAVALAVLALVAASYLTGVLLVNRRGGARWPATYTISFLAGLVVCGLATNSSIAVYDMSLFSAHMIGHLMLVMLAPALLMAGRPLSLLLQSAQGQRRDRIAAILTGRVLSLLTAPPVALASYIVVIVGTHLTGLMNFIMRNTWAGQLEHLAYVLLGCQFFVVVIGDAPIRWKLGVPARFFMLALSMAVDTFTGVVLLQSTTAVAMSPPPGASINPITDTQTGGAIMWFGGDGIMAVIMVIIAIGWVHQPESSRIEASGWLEQARRANFAEHTGTAGQIADDFDDDDQRLAQYNDWLHRLDSRPHQ
ncbi:MAG: cytochrome c oxidase assembly protein [Actinomycetota bacterium]|nr:cytochrome c oxidase assembly protein [Actinomycetota bacterium]